ncbi:hypothetical protein G7B40_015230 [Aetokthonos hydrillicola Thurmond2011]|jgi:tetratricopeptide (TPR) repeat protein|uniref:Novel STAND NTPase 1 domain-containing protein n=1 Tax=Aetokthonos hydrillicola Thurmond2011 TaxID=2712845 RepID=A0AAP5IB97_9CYAN|nr:hypothetical protein [Aetokthonos hydrillicola]MBW4586739.1 hypothetical protein [Aetokthonos hydrillicola CCALA 1050]MDR9895905.1 hypothetical protein [Aetokthonos hydrillicola Thurmond2011]
MNPNLSDPSNHDRSLEQLAWAIEASVGRFKLILARCNYTEQRSHLINRLREICQVEIRILVLKKSTTTLYTAIREELGEEVPSALMVLGLESVQNLGEILALANQVREEFRNFPFPLVLWVDNETHKQMMQFAPDLESWAISKDFPLSANELIDFLNKTAERLFIDSSFITLETCSEILSAWQELQSFGQVLEPEVKAKCDFLLGLAEYINKNLDNAIEHYQKSLVSWQEQNNLEWQGKVLLHITFCCYEKDIKNRQRRTNSLNRVDKEPLSPNLEAARNYLLQYLKLFEVAQRRDLIANSIDKFGIILQDLEDWEHLQTLAIQALEIHKAEENKIKIAQDYRFLAEVALAKEEWNEAQDLAEKALQVLPTIETLHLKPLEPLDKAILSTQADIAHQQQLLADKSVILSLTSSSLLILARSQHKIGEYQAAISNLEAARKIGVIDSNPQLYIDILINLRKLYFEQKQYLKAFEAKLERNSVEQQYGLRAFIGAGRLEATRMLETRFITPLQNNVIPEIALSGRQLDINRLLERIGRLDYKLIVIYGQSGVGKSSLVNAGLVPALKKRAIGIQDNLPVVMQVYTNWVEELGRLLAEALAQKRIEVEKTESTYSTAAILEKLRQCEQRNLRPVIIFDQFEEFFFVDTEPAQRQEFFEFLGECLNILPLKVILSLREDYLHYLLKCNRLPSMTIINNDILSNHVLYELGNFSPTDAKEIIQQLTEPSHFHLEPALIDELVKDLAGNLGEVRPIELQIVGAQLQAEDITTLTQYRQHGTKEELVKSYLAAVVEDCGNENQQMAEFVLYLLTDEKGTRPFKTRAELEWDLQALGTRITTSSQELDLVLQVFVDSGIVVLVPETPVDRYQLVHDYIAAFIRQQQEPQLTALMAELEEERKQRLLAEEGLQQAEQAREILAKANQKATQRIRLGSGVLATSLVLAAVVGGFATQERNNALKSTTLEREGVANEQQFHSQEQEIEALISAMQTGQELQTLVKDSRSIEKYPAASPQFALQTILDNIREQNRLQGHTDIVISARFSPDGKRILTASADKTARLWQVESLEDLLARGCKWLNNYLIIHPQDLKLLKVCQNQSNLTAAARFLVKEGEEQARAGKIDEATATFRTALKLNPNLKLDPKAKAQAESLKGKAERLVLEGASLLKEGKIKEALADYKEAQNLDPKVEIDAGSWNSLCRYGSLHGYAGDVMFACEKAVALAPGDGAIRDSRGLARALTGNTQGAIEDFETFIQSTDNQEQKSQRQRWVNALRAGKNPFTDEELKSLVDQ